MYVSDPFTHIELTHSHSKHLKKKRKRRVEPETGEESPNKRGGDELCKWMRGICRCCEWLFINEYSRMINVTCLWYGWMYVEGRMVHFKLSCSHSHNRWRKGERARLEAGGPERRGMDELCHGWMNFHQCNSTSFISMVTNGLHVSRLNERVLVMYILYITSKFRV